MSPALCCKVEWSVVGNDSGMSSSYHDGCPVTVQWKGPSVDAG